MPQRILILSALLPEARAFARALGLGGRFTPSSRRVGNDDVAVALIGPAARHLVAAVQGCAPRIIILAGLGGALAPNLRHGDIVVDAPQGIVPEELMARHALHAGRIQSSPTLIAAPGEKARLFGQSGALAVDMESDPARELAHGLGVPIVVMRAVSDTAFELIDPQVLRLVDGHGRPRTGAAIGYLARHPVRLASLLRLRSISSLALARLGGVLSDLSGRDLGKFP